MGETVAMVRMFNAGKRRVTLSVPQVRSGQIAHTVIEWGPDMPCRLSRLELKQYREGRDKAFADMCRELGIAGALVEI